MTGKLLRLGGTLAVCCAVAAFGLSFTYGKTWALIEKQKQEAQLAAVRAVLPGMGDAVAVRPLELAPAFREANREVDSVFEGTSGGSLTGHAIQIRSRGYGGPVVLMVGVDPAGSILDVTVVEHRETPGLGTYIEEEWFRRQFRGKSAAATLAINKDIDGVSGATISGKAVARGARAALAAHAALGGGIR